MLKMKASVRTVAVATMATLAAGAVMAAPAHASNTVCTVKSGVSGAVYRASDWARIYSVPEGGRFQVKFFANNVAYGYGWNHPGVDGYILTSNFGGCVA